MKFFDASFDKLKEALRSRLQNFSTDVDIKDEEIIEANTKTLLEILPPCPFDVQCAGNKRKQREASSAYKVITAMAFMPGVYDDDINDLIDNYDFTNYRRALKKRKNKITVKYLLKLKKLIGR